MWTREDLKNRAKDVLRRNYWMPFLASLIYGLIVSFAGGNSGSASVPSTNTTLNLTEGELQNSELQRFIDQYLGQIETSELLSFLALGSLAVLIIWVVCVLIAWALQFFVLGPMAVGHNRFYLTHRHRDADLGVLFSGFKKGYLNLAGAQFVTQLLISLLTLAFIVPGIIFSYKWYQVPYILAENPHLSGKRAREISDAMTKGDKWEMFVLGLSFIGWYLLGALCCGVGTLFVTPYEQATFAELYAVQRQRVLDAGLATAEELPGI